MDAICGQTLTTKIDCCTFKCFWCRNLTKTRVNNSKIVNNLKEKERERRKIKREKEYDFKSAHKLGNLERRKMC